jgi:hypothetical protein
MLRWQRENDKYEQHESRQRYIDGSMISQRLLENPLRIHSPETRDEKSFTAAKL